MIAKKMLFLSAAGSVLLLAACQTAQDVPVPEDEQAKEWTGPIKTAYPEWQPTQEMPKGNAEYDACFAAAPKTAAPEPVEAVDLAAAQEENTEKAQYPILYAPCPDKVRLDVAENGDFLVNGSVLPAEIVEKYLNKIVAAHKEKSAAIIYIQSSKAPMDKANDLLEICRKAKVANVTFIAPQEKAVAKKPVAKAKKPAKKKAVKMVIDTAKPGTAYVVKKDDTLGGIARKFYGRASLAGLIFEHNKKTVKDIHKIVPGMKIMIPALKEAE